MARCGRLASLALLFAWVVSTPGLASAQSPFEGGAAAPRNRIDTIVFARLQRLGIQPSALSSDAVFLRRVFLDTIGTLPTAAEARAFLEDRSPDSRGRLVDRLLARPEFADYWAMKWAEVLRVKSEFPINLWPNAVQAYHRWIRASLRDNVPYDRFVRQMLTESGSNFRVPPVNFYRAVQGRDPEAIASAVALTFMGTRVDRWPKERVSAMARFFSQIGYKATGEWKEEIVFFDRDKGATAGAGSAGAVSGAPAAQSVTFPDGTAGRIAPGQDPREVFAGWLVSPGNPWFARAIANRVWYWLLGRGIVDEPDDLRPDNPPANPELLAFLEREVVAARFDLRPLYRLILNSTTYQLASIRRSPRPDAETQFASALLRPLEPEVLIDAIDQVTGSTEQYSSAIPEPYTFIPPNQRSIALADGSISSSFLVAFGRSPRDTGQAAERSRRPTPEQRLYLLNSGDMQRKIQQGPRLQALVASQADPRELIVSLYLTILSRFPSEDELKITTSYARSSGGNRRVVAQDLAWALMNTAEFRYRH